jgi:hypothetical protein
MTYKLKTKDIIRINFELNKIDINEINQLWNTDKHRNYYFDFPSDNPIIYIEKYYEDMKIFFIQNLRNIVFRFINSRLNIDVFSTNSINLNIDTGLYYINPDKFSFIEFYQILNTKNGNLSNKFIKTTIIIDRLPTAWVNTVLFEIVKITDDEIQYFNGTYKPSCLRHVRFAHNSNYISDGAKAPSEQCKVPSVFKDKKNNNIPQENEELEVEPNEPYIVDGTFL